MSSLFKYYIKLIVLLMLPMLGASLQGFAQQSAASARMDTTKLLIGQQVYLKLELRIPSGTVVSWPNLKDTIPTSLDMVEAFKIDTSYSADKKETILSQKLRVTSFDTGIHVVAPIPFYQRTKKGDTMGLLASTQEFFYSVMTVPVDTTRAIRDIKGTMGIPFTFKELLPYIGLGILLLAVVFGLIYYIRRRRKNKPFIILPPKPGLPPHVIALEDLEKLRKAQLWQSGRVKEYYTGLTDILRTYMEGRFGFNAMEMTTFEIMQHLHSDIKASGITDKLREVLELADLVKFAKENPLPDRHDYSLNLGVAFVNTTQLAQKEVSSEATASENSTIQGS